MYLSGGRSRTTLWAAVRPAVIQGPPRDTVAVRKSATAGIGSSGACSSSSSISLSCGGRLSLQCQATSKLVSHHRQAVSSVANDIDTQEMNGFCASMKAMI